MLLPLRTRTEFSGKQGFAKVSELVAYAKEQGNTHLAITDLTTFSHVTFEKECRLANIVPIFGLETCDPVGRPLVLLAKTAKGLAEIYATAGNQSVDAADLSDAVVVLHHPALLIDRGSSYCMCGPGLVGANVSGHPVAAVSNPLYLKPEDREAYEIHNPREPFCMGRHHLTYTEIEWPDAWIHGKDALELADSFDPFDLPRATAPKVQGHFALKGDCLEGAKALGLKLTKPYQMRLAHELKVIHDKGFEGYFQMVSDLTGWAKEQGIFVGPGRGSSGGSLVAFLLGITEVDPLRFGLLFERFLDPSRSDTPDIDLDFPDDRRDEIFAYLTQKYGQARTARLGTTLRYGGKSALKDGAKALGITDKRLEELGEMVYIPLAGEVKDDCLADVFNSEAGQKTTKIFPELLNLTKLEGRAKTTGVHAAGFVISPEPIRNHASVSGGVAQIDMHDAEDLGLVKLDCLGLRTMAILERACALLGWSYQQLLDIPLEDSDALGQFLQQNYAGIFQWEGETLRSLTSQTPPENFEDLVLLTSIARPGPLQAGMGNDFKRVQNGTYLGAGSIWGKGLDNSRGILAYQEQVMALLYSLGFQDKEVGVLRKAMSKSKVSVLAEYEAEFYERGRVSGFGPEQVERAWNQIKGVGAYLFNRSHAVAYTLISWWCAYLKQHHPLEFYCAAMDRAPSPEAGAEMLREMIRRDIPYKVIDPERSMAEWTIQSGTIIGALTAMPGYGAAKAAAVIKRRVEGKLTPLQVSQLEKGITIYSAASQTPELLASIRAGRSVPLLSMEDCKRRGGWVLGYIETRFLIDYSSPKMVSKYGPSKPGREKTLALIIVDEQNSVNATLTGRAYALLAETMETVPDKLWGLFNLNRWEKNGKLYLNDYRSLDA